jgi:hypothetical protein
MSDTVTRVTVPPTVQYRAACIETHETDSLNIPDGTTDRDLLVILALRCLEHESRIATTRAWRAQVAYLVDRIQGYGEEIQ